MAVTTSSVRWCNTMPRYTVGVVIRTYREVNIEAPNERDAQRQAVEHFDNENPESLVEPHMVVDSSEDT